MTKKVIKMIHPNATTLKTLLIVLCLAVIFFIPACEKTSEQPQKPAVVSQKIPVEVTETSEPNDPGKNPVPEDTLAENIQEEIEPEKGVVRENVSEEISVDPGSMGLDTEIESFIGTELAEVEDFYNPENKIDPFKPLFREGPKEKEVEVSQKVQREKRIPRTPLERIDLNQLKLVGIIQVPGGNKGMVEEASGKGYIVSLGTYIGMNGGRVIDILNDRIIVEEETEDVLGKLILQKRELKLQKPFGEN